MFIIRAAFWLSIVLMLIPGEPGSNKSLGAAAVDAALAARAAVADLSGLCDRQPDACIHGGAAVATLSAGAAAGAARLVGHLTGGGAAATGATPLPASSPVQARGTLTADDAAATFRLPATVRAPLGGKPPHRERLKPAKAAGNA